MNLKTKLTKYVAAQHELPTDEKSIKTYTVNWWVNPRQKDIGGLQLTYDGFARMSSCFKAHKVLFEEPIPYSNKTILQLDNFINCPWFTSDTEIYVFNEKMAVQLVLFNGNINRFLSAKARNPIPAN